MARRSAPYAPGTQVGIYTVLEVLPDPSGRILKARYRVNLACCGRDKEVNDNLISQIFYGKVISGYCRECLNALRRNGDPTRAFVKRPPTLAATWRAVLALPVSPLLQRDLWGMPCCNC